MPDLFHLFFLTITRQRPSEERGLNEENLKQESLFAMLYQILRDHE